MGPASLSDRVLARLPEATVVGVDADPVLLTLAREAASPGLQLVDADLRRPDWPQRIPSDPYDAVLSTTALHWLKPSALRAVYAACARLLRPGGLFANGDHLRVLASPRLDALARELDRRRSARHHGEGKDWRGWWDAVRADPDLSDAMSERERRQFDHPEETETSLAIHQQALRRPLQRSGGVGERDRCGARGAALTLRDSADWPAPREGGGAGSPLIDMHDASAEPFLPDRVAACVPHMLDAARSVPDASVGVIRRSAPALYRNDAPGRLLSRHPVEPIAEARGPTGRRLRNRSGARTG